MFLALQDAELSFLHMLRNASNNFLDKLFEIITFFGEQYAIIVIVVLLFFAFDKKKAERIIYSIFTCTLLNGVVKLFVRRPRPFSNDVSNPVTPAREQTATGYSFPSGHTQNSSVMYSSISINFRKKWILITSISLIILIGFSRLWLGVHYPTDVLAGLVLGVSIAFLGNYLYSKFENNFKSKMILIFATAIVFLPLVIYFYVKYKISMPQDNIEGYYRLSKDMFVSYGMYLGFAFAVLIENKYVNFDCNVTTKTKIIRCILAIVFVLATYGLTSLIFKSINPFCIELDLIRYFLISFVGIGIYPLLFKKSLFKKESQE